MSRSYKSSQVKSCMPEGGLLEEQATKTQCYNYTWLYTVYRVVKLRLSMTSRHRQNYSEHSLFLNDYCVRRCTKSENASHATSKRLLTNSLQLSNPEKRAKASRYVCQEFRGLPRIRAPFGDQFIARLTHRSADNVVTWCAKFQYEWRHLQDQLFNRKL